MSCMYFRDGTCFAQEGAPVTKCEAKLTKCECDFKVAPIKSIVSRFLDSIINEYNNTNYNFELHLDLLNIHFILIDKKINAKFRYGVSEVTFYHAITDEKYLTRLLDTIAEEYEDYYCEG